MKHLLHIRHQIERRGGQKALAAALGVSASYLSDVMNGKRDVSPALAMKLETACGINGLRLLTQQVEHQWLEFKKNPKPRKPQ